MTPPRQRDYSPSSTDQTFSSHIQPNPGRGTEYVGRWRKSVMLNRKPAVLPCQPIPIQAQVSHFGEPGAADEQHVISARWAATQGRACRLCPQPACTFHEHPDGQGVCHILIRGRLDRKLAAALGLPAGK